MTTSAYLMDTPDDEVIHGRLVLDGKEWVIEDGTPMLNQTVKRLFPGAVRRKNEGKLKFMADKRSTGDLNWLMMRYPLQRDEHVQQVFEQKLKQARAHDERRRGNDNITPITQPRDFVGQLKDFQKEGAAFLLANEKAILGDDMGLGKTVTTLGAIGSLGKFPVVVCCPKNVAQQWVDQANRFLPGITTNLIQGLTASKLPDAQMHVLHYGLLTAWCEQLEAINPELIVFDECQELRRAESLKYSSASLLTSSIQHAWGLSGTPIYNQGGEIWCVTNALDFNCLGSFESFTREWCNGYGSTTVREPATLNDHLKREGLMLRRRKQDVLTELPPKHHVTIDLAHDQDKYATLIAKAVEAAHQYANASNYVERGQFAREVEQESRKAIGLAKAPYVAEFVRKLLEEGHRPLVFAHHHAVHDELAERLWAYGPRKITGKESDKQKREAAQAFKTGATKMLQMALRSSAGIDGLQQQATCAVFAELDWSPAIHSQCEDRVHRLGLPRNMKGVWCYYLVAEGSYDQVVQYVLAHKIQQFKGIMGDATVDTEALEKAIKEAKEHLRELLLKEQGGGSDALPQRK